MNLLLDEKHITTPVNQVLTLTNYRIQKHSKDWSSSSSITIFLEDISSIEAKYENNIILLILAILFTLGFVYCFFGGNAALEQPSYIAAGLAIICIIAWIASRQYVIKIAPNGGSALHLNVSRLKKSTADELVETIEQAKGIRVRQLRRSPDVTSMV